MATLLTLKDTSLLLSRSTLFPTRATKAPGPARWANSSTNSFAFSNERLCVMSYTTRGLPFARNKCEIEISNNRSVTIVSWSRRTLLRRMFAERTNEHGLRLRLLNFLKNHLIIFMLIVKCFLTFAKSFGVMRIAINISVQQVRFAHIGPSCFIEEVKKQKN